MGRMELYVVDDGLLAFADDALSVAILDSGVGVPGYEDASHIGEWWRLGEG